jgi:hypothetical protein
MFTPQEVQITVAIGMFFNGVIQDVPPVIDDGPSFTSTTIQNMN